MARRCIGRIVGLTGYAGSGKDTAALVLIANGCLRMAFADGVRALAMEVDAVMHLNNGAHTLLSATVVRNGWDRAKGHEDVRRHLQRLGKGVRDIIGPDAWVDALGRRWGALGFPDVVVTDVRYPNEAAWVRARGGMVIRVDRPGVGPLNGHESETLVGSIEADEVVVNDGTPEQLKQEVLRVVQGYWRTPTGDRPS